MLTDAQRIEVLEERLAEAVRKRDFVREWYSTRFERLQDLMKEHGIWDKGAAIIANGSLISESDTYWGQLNFAKHRAHVAEKALADLQAK